MPVAFASPHKFLCELADALGEKYVRGITLTAHVDHPPIVDVTRFARQDEAGRVVEVVKRYELREIVPVPEIPEASPADRPRNWLSRLRRQS